MLYWHQDLQIRLSLSRYQFFCYLPTSIFDTFVSVSIFFDCDYQCFKKYIGIYWCNDIYHLSVISRYIYWDLLVSLLFILSNMLTCFFQIPINNIIITLFKLFIVSTFINTSSNFCILYGKFIKNEAAFEILSYLLVFVIIALKRIFCNVYQSIQQT